MTGSGVGRRARRLIPVSGLTAVLLVWTAVPASAQDHNHFITSPVDIGPLVLKVALLVALPAVAGFAMMRGFLGTPSRGTAAFVAVCAAVAVCMQLLLSSGFALPPIAIPLTLAAAGWPVYLAFADREPPWLLRASAPALTVAVSALAALLFAKAWLGTPDGEDRTALLHTGMMVAFAGLAWLTIGVPRNRLLRAGVLVTAAAVGFTLVAAGTQVAAAG